jgi:hypothetical protein
MRPCSAGERSELYTGRARLPLGRPTLAYARYPPARPPSNDPVADLFIELGNAPSTGWLTHAGRVYLLTVSSTTVTDKGASPASAPEPGTLGLMMLGFAGVVLCGRLAVSSCLAVLGTVEELPEQQLRENCGGRRAEMRRHRANVADVK